MDFIRRAWLFTKAKIGRTILLIVAFSAILIFVLSGLIINSAANVSIDNAKKSAGATVSLSVNMQNVIKEAQNSATSSSSSSSSSDTAEAGKRFNIDLPTISETTASSCVLSDLSPVLVLKKFQQVVVLQVHQQIRKQLVDLVDVKEEWAEVAKRISQSVGQMI